MSYRFAACLLLLGSFVLPAAKADDNRLLRLPDIHRDRVAFVYAGDIYVAPTAGGTARRLTSHAGLELFPKFSPDGSRIAFSAEYNGTRQVFVMPTEGGEPRQLTWYNDVGSMPPRGGFDYRVLDWTPDGEHILVRANRLPWGVRMGRHYLVPADGGDETPLEIPEGGGGMYSPDGNRIVYTPIDREFRTWKRYRGGRAQDVWVYDLEASTAEQLHRPPGNRQSAALGGRRDLLHVGPRLHAQPVSLRRVGTSRAGHGPRSLRRALAERRAGGDRLRERRLAVSLRPRLGLERETRHPGRRRPSGASAARRRSRRVHSGRRPVARRPARDVQRARRGVYGAR